MIHREEDLQPLLAPVLRSSREPAHLRHLSHTSAGEGAIRGDTDLRRASLRSLLARVPGRLGQSALLLGAVQATRAPARGGEVRDHDPQRDPEALGAGCGVPSGLVERYLRSHAVTVQPRTIRSLQERLRRPVAAFGDVPVRELERQVAEIAAWRAGFGPVYGPLWSLRASRPCVRKSGQLFGARTLTASAASFASSALSSTGKRSHTGRRRGRAGRCRSPLARSPQSQTSPRSCARRCCSRHRKAVRSG